MSALGVDVSHPSVDLQQKPTQQFTESLSGLIERVTFFNEKTVGRCSK